MELREVQVCESTQPFHIEHVMSHSHFGQVYEVLIPNPDAPYSEWVCTCEGFHYRGHCSHQEDASATLCRWSESAGNLRQTKEQKDARVCPKCGGSTILMTEVL